jgi:hypothetical protein
MSLRRLPRSEVRRHLKPYADEIGQVTLAWNSLHENLCILFSYAIGPGRVPFAIWNRLSSDRTQRDILKTAVEAGAFGTSRHGLNEDVLWLLSQTDALAEHRNVAIHAPLTTLTDVATGKTVVEPADFLGNKRAKSLKGIDIIRELEWCAECAASLSYFAADVISTVNGSPESWPERPSLTLPPSHSRGRTKR